MAKRQAFCSLLFHFKFFTVNRTPVVRVWLDHQVTQDGPITWYKSSTGESDPYHQRYRPLSSEIHEWQPRGGCAKGLRSGVHWCGAAWTALVLACPPCCVSHTVNSFTRKRTTLPWLPTPHVFTEEEKWMQKNIIKTFPVSSPSSKPGNILLFCPVVFLMHYYRLSCVHLEFTCGSARILNVGVFGDRTFKEGIKLMRLPGWGQIQCD